MTLMRRGTRNLVLYSLLAVPAGLLALPSRAPACSVPVFRYALERWPPDFFPVLVFHKGPLSAEDKKTVDWLEKTADSEGSLANLHVRTVDLGAEKVDERAKAVYDEHGKGTLPVMVALFPIVSRKPRVVLSEPLSLAGAKTLAVSPARHEVARRLLGGESAVWVFLESGKKKADDEAHKRLAESLKKLQSQLRLPAQEAGPVPPGQAGEEEEPEGPKLRIAFSILRLSRTDKAETAFLRMLMRSEEDLEKEYANSVITFPIFGRGRALFALVDEGINEENVAEACEFLVGACSCQVKQLNPGTDMLMAVDWVAGLERTLVGETPLPVLPGAIGGVPTAVPVAPATQPAAAAPNPGSLLPDTRPASEIARSMAAPASAAPPAPPSPSQSGGGVLAAVLWTLGGLAAAAGVLALWAVFRRPAA